MKIGFDPYLAEITDLKCAIVYSIIYAFYKDKNKHRYTLESDPYEYEFIDITVEEIRSYAPFIGENRIRRCIYTLSQKEILRIGPRTPNIAPPYRFGIALLKKYDGFVEGKDDLE